MIGFTEEGRPVHKMTAKFYPKVKILEDNQSTIAIANSDGYQSRAKHIEERYHFVRDQVKHELYPTAMFHRG